MLIWRGFDPFRLYEAWREYLGTAAPPRPRLQVVVNHRPCRDETKRDRAAVGHPTKSRSDTKPK